MFLPSLKASNLPARQPKSGTAVAIQPQCLFQNALAKREAFLIGFENDVSAIIMTLFRAEIARKKARRKPEYFCFNRASWFNAGALAGRIAACRRIKAIRPADDVRGAAFDFIVNASDVFADHAEREELNAA